MLFKIADRFPPCLCRLVARKGWTPMSTRDLAAKSGLSKSYVSNLSKRSTWKGIPIDVVDRFVAACGINLLSPKRTIEYLKSSKMIHLKRATATQRKLFAAIFAIKR